MAPNTPPDPATPAPDDLQTEASAFAAAWAVFGLLMVLVIIFLTAISLIFP